MKRDNRLLFYLVLNVIVSAATTLSVLLIWDWIQQARMPAQYVQMSTTTPGVNNETLPAAGEQVLVIDNVFGVGRLQDEVVLIRHTGNHELSLAGWKLVDENNLEYIFPRITLNQGEINIYTQAGVDTAKDLHWGQAQSVWKFGEKVRILDPLGNQRAEYTIP
ncbi:MAG: lamin tail domain-containing protein [Anaerolineae bacterium]|nr:lamin tail domain-containing protein [Anaerolineae bacterium]